LSAVMPIMLIPRTPSLRQTALRCRRERPTRVIPPPVQGTAVMAAPTRAAAMTATTRHGPTTQAAAATRPAAAPAIPAHRFPLRPVHPGVLRQPGRLRAQPSPGQQERKINSSRQGAGVQACPYFFLSKQWL
jgi:hypothetical protein